jgi:hypothetical protein
MLDGIMLVTMIVCFEVATTRFVDFLVDVDGTVENTDLRSPLVMLYITAAYFFLRELIQVIASLALGIFRSWLYDTTNWLDVLVIALVTHFTTNMALGEEILLSSTEGTTEDYLGNFRTGTALTKGVLWTAVIFFLRSTQVDFAVFLNGVFYVVRRLVAFLLAMLVILISFAQMFWLVYLEQPVCKFSCSEGDTECQAEMDGCNYPHCEFGDSFLKVRCVNDGRMRIGTLRMRSFVNPDSATIIHSHLFYSCLSPIRDRSHRSLTPLYYLSSVLGIHHDDGRNWIRNTI